MQSRDAVRKTVGTGLCEERNTKAGAACTKGVGEDLDLGEACGECQGLQMHRGDCFDYGRAMVGFKECA